MVAILNYGIGNVHSIYNMLKKINVSSLIATTVEDVAKADKLILPGVGHFDYCMQQFQQAPFFEAVNQRVLKEQVPVLGVCVGCQMLFSQSEEGQEKGLGWIPGTVIKFRQDKMDVNRTIPHMAWTDVAPQGDNRLFKDINEPRFYFVHSYHISGTNEAYVTSKAFYGYEFVASVKKENIMGVQFHPEKSHKFGMKLYENFAKHI
jgi:imidazole glycerol-phosphate synthase subunit HisH